MESSLLSPQDAAAYLGISRETLDTARRARKIEAVKLGGLWKYTQDALDRYIAACTVPATT